MDQSDNSDMDSEIGSGTGAETGARPWMTTQERNRDRLAIWCDLAAGLDTVRGRWKASILVALDEADRDMPALQKRLDAADRRVLVRALRQLEADRLVSRSGAGNGYALSPDGAELVGILRAIARWQAARL